MVLGVGEGRWSDRDRVAAIALVKYEASLCTGCSQDVASWGTGKSLVVKETVCPGCAALDKHRAENSKPEPGAKQYLVSDEMNPSEMDGDEELPVWLTSGATADAAGVPVGEGAGSG